jgi:hypothetical protein
MTQLDSGAGAPTLNESLAVFPLWFLRPTGANEQRG